ncbi:unnamed protein product [Parnassius mnemosyne]|uniref:Uncharacterized protein n=1 Tax=Parnassius mnemosyne TaxID=213953 RepID=A0AAV1KHN5_9NEOP
MKAFETSRETEITFPFFPKDSPYMIRDSKIFGPRNKFWVGLLLEIKVLFIVISLNRSKTRSSSTIHETTKT